MSLKLLCVVAHPDDECFAFGGALALAADQGVECCVVCLTDGQAATNRGAATSAAELGRMRRQEFSDSCRVLGVTEHEMLDFQDGQLEFADFSKTAGLLVKNIRHFQPDVVVTFAADGTLNTHPDHTMVSAFTATAFHWAASAKRFPELGPVHRAQRLFVVTTSFFMEDRPAPLPSPWNLVLDVRSVQARKQEAFRQHTSQAPLMEKTRGLFEKYGHEEFYTLIAQHDPGEMQILHSMFEGLQPQAPR